jgi:ribosomal protein S12 methylthiotransferase
VSERVKRARYERVMVTQAGVAARRVAALAGSEVEVLVEREAGRGRLVGRTTAQAPEIDGTVRLGGVAAPGDVVRARITGGDVYDLEGVVLSSPVDTLTATP